MDWLWFLVGYLFGSTPTGYLAVKLVQGEDIRNYGSGNIGATNVGRVMGRRWAVAVAVFDMLKGGIAVGLARLAGVDDTVVLALVGLFGVLGHNFPVWLRFKGGKGVATSFGVLFFFHPAAAVLGGIVWYVTMRVTRYVSVASIFSLATAPVWLIVVAAPLPFVIVAAFLDVLTIFRHRPNIVRLLAGTENKVGLKKEEVLPEPGLVMPAETYVQAVKIIVEEVPAEPDEMEDFLPDWSECPESVKYVVETPTEKSDSEPADGAIGESQAEPEALSADGEVTEDVPEIESILETKVAEAEHVEEAESAVKEEPPAPAPRKRRRRKTVPVEEKAAGEPARTPAALTSSSPASSASRRGKKKKAASE